VTAVEKNLSVEQGATFKFFFQWRVPTGPTTSAPRNLTGWVIRMEARKSQKGVLVLSASTTDGKIDLGVDPENPATDPDLDQTDPNRFPVINPGIPNPSNGWVRLRLTDDDTDLLTSASTRYDMEAEAPNGDVYRLMQGSINVSANITQMADDPAME
jgi:hypothetical protein